MLDSFILWNGKGRPFQYFGSSNVWNFKKKSEKITVSLIDWTHVSMQQHLKKKMWSIFPELNICQSSEKWTVLDKPLTLTWKRTLSFLSSFPSHYWLSLTVDLISSRNQPITNHQSVEILASNHRPNLKMNHNGCRYQTWRLKINDIMNVSIVSRMFHGHESLVKIYTQDGWRNR